MGTVLRLVQVSTSSNLSGFFFLILQMLSSCNVETLEDGTVNTRKSYNLCLVNLFFLLVLHVQALRIKGESEGQRLLISLPTGTKIFNWLITYLGNLPLSKSTSAFFTLLFLLMFTIGGSTGVILGNAAVDLALHDTYYV